MPRVPETPHIAAYQCPSAIPVGVVVSPDLPANRTYPREHGNCLEPVAMQKVGVNSLHVEAFVRLLAAPEWGTYGPSRLRGLQKVEGSSRPVERGRRTKAREDG